MSDNEIPLCSGCGSVMDGPATGIGYWCPNLECGDESLLKARELFKNTAKIYSEAELQEKLQAQEIKHKKELAEFLDELSGVQAEWEKVLREKLDLQKKSCAVAAMDIVGRGDGKWFMQELVNAITSAEISTEGGGDELACIFNRT